MDRRGCVLIVDDTVSIRETLTAILKPDHYTLLTAGSGEEALTLAEDHVPDVILLDVMMPGMSGFDVCRVLRQSPRLGEVPVIIVTALDDRSSLLEGLDAGADDFLTKPIDHIELRARVRSIVRLNRYRRLLDERERFRQVADSSSDAIVSVDGEGRVTFANQRACGLLGEPAEGAIARRLISAEDAEEFDAWIASGATNEARGFQCQSADGHAFTAEITVGRGTWRGEPSTTWVLRDVTERDRLRAAAQSVDRLEAIAKSTAGLAHDFANYLMAIRMGLELLPGTEPAKLDACLEPLYKQIDNATTLVQRINLFAKGGSAPMARLNLATVVADVEPMLRHMVGRERLAMSLGATPAVSGDAVQIGQVVSNLVINAGHAVAKDGRIEVRTFTDDSGQAVLQVQDNGCGMDEATRAKVFEPYFTTRAGRGGTGLGLAMVYGIMRNCGGTIDLESTVGVGTTFTLRWPPAAA